jgi:hypothetical protein
MTQENTTPETTTPEANAVHHAAKRGADMSLARKEISPDSHKAVHEGRISLEEARELGRNAAPSGPAVRADKNDRSRPCLCACGEVSKAGRFKPGHDMRMVTLAKAHVRGEADLTDEQMEYVQESGKLDRARLQVEKEEHKREEKTQQKAERQRRREGEAEAKKSEE